MNSKFLVLSLLLGLLCFSSLKAQAIEYYELEVYGYNLANRHELEIENGSSASSDTQKDIAGRIFRSTFEFNYGVSDHWELAAYLDYTQADNQFEYTAFRTHARTAFAEKGQLPVDLGAYIELALPRNYRQTDMSIELKSIIEKDISRWTISLNPSVEFAHTNGDTDDVIIGGDTDDGPLTATTVTRPKNWQANWGMSSEVAYHISSRWQPHLDWYTSFTDGSSMIMPAVDFRIANLLKATAGLGFGQNDRTEQRLVSLRLEYEMY